MDAVIFVIFLLCLLYSVWLRTRHYRQFFPDDARISPISQALQDLIAIAGGIYLSLILLISFLKLTVPEKIEICALAVDPLAFFSLCLGIVQPIILNLIKKVK